MRTNSERLEYDADIVESYLAYWDSRNPNETHMKMFFREHVQVLRDVADKIR